MKLGITRYKFKDGTFAYMADTYLPHKLVMETANFTVEIPDEPSDVISENHDA